MITLTPPLRRELQITPHGAYGEPRPARGGTHRGLDFRAATGDPVLAAAAGTVDRQGFDPPVGAGGNGGGRYVVLRHVDGANVYETAYMHLNSINVADGTRVDAGTMIGTAGSTGTSDGASHLHFELRHVDGSGGRVHLDPTALLPAARPSSSKAASPLSLLPFALLAWRLFRWIA